MRKKLISWLAAIAVFAAAFQTVIFDTGAVSAADEYEPYTQSTAFLKGIGIIDGKDDINMNVTRGKAAMLICQMLDENKNLQNYRGIFADVAADSEEALSIEKLADLGIVHGSENYTYRPSDMLTYTEASYIFANVLGYGLISNSGITPLQVIQDFGINDNIKAEFDYVTLGDFYVMMKNALFSGSYVQSTFGSNAEYTKTDRTLLYSIYDIVYDDGRIVRNDVTSLWSAENYEDSSMQVELSSDGSTLKVKTPDPSVVRDDLGKSIRLYYKKNKDTGDFDYVYHELKSGNKIVNVKLEMIDTERTNFEKATISYYSESDRRYSANLSSDVSVIYNGTAYKNSSFDFKAAGDKVGYVELIDSDGNSRYETVKITVYDSIIAGVVSTSNNFISDKYESNKVIDINSDNYTKIFVYDADGSETDFSAITQGSIVSAAKSDTFGNNGENILTLRVSTNVVNGKITKVRNSNSVQYITIDDENTYGIYDRAADESYMQNSNIVVYIDVFGNVVYTTTDYQRDMQYGILAGVGKTSSSIDPKVRVRIVSSAGKVSEYQLDKKVYIDGDSYSGKELDAYEKLSGISFKTSDITFPTGVSPIRYKLSEDGLTVKKLDTIQTSKDNQDDALELMGSGTYYCNTGQVLGWKIPFAADAVVLEFLSPDYSKLSAFKDELDIAVNNASMFRQGTSYHVAALKSDKESSTADFILKFNFTNIKIGYDNDFFVVDEVSEAMNEVQDSIMYLVSGYLKGSYTQFWVDKSHSQADIITSLKRGDVIRYDDSKDGRLINCEKLLSIDGNKVTTETADGNNFRVDWGSSLTLVCGYAYSVDNTLVRVNRFEPGTFDLDVSALDWDKLISDDALCYINAQSSIPVTVVDMGRDKIYSGSVEDIYDYKNFKNDSSLVFAKYRSGILGEIVVFNK